MRPLVVDPSPADLCSNSWWSWGESNPRPSGGDCPRYDHSRVRASRLAHRRVGWGRSPAAGSFSDVNGLPRRQRSFPSSSAASVAGLRWNGPVRHHWSLFPYIT